ncbi:MAG: putative modification methylase [Prokaryotic dsDNA virus sp.]|nr:MAG: putative modification methylase [Prokaryotic dsDNA virus sp.]|tara:strand:- start:18694 stop:20250 length:1557 start_codon:yes stop_codon:yes gene_type:complete
MSQSQPQKSEAAAVYVDPSTLTPWNQNPRNNEAAIDEVAKSIQRFGFASPIVARTADGRVIAGHTRLAAALRLGLEDVPVRFLDIDEQLASALALADNKIGEIATWDDETLGQVLAELEQDGMDLGGLGWDEDELDRILEAANPPQPEPMTEDEVDWDSMPEDVPAITQAGDVIELGRHVLHCGDCIETMRGMPENSIDAIVTDPPYGIGFMSKNWDVAVPGEDWARECLRVLKPGGHLIAFAATRTVHRLTVAVEDAGFEIRDQIAHIQYQGFPKSLSVPAQLEGSDAQRFEGYGTALKPAFEPAVLARKPLSGTVAANCLEWGTGGLNIDGCRYAYGDPAWPGPGDRPPAVPQRDNLRYSMGDGAGRNGERLDVPELGRWPANIYACPKPSRSEREQGCEELPGRTGAEAVERKEGTAGLDNPRAGAGRTASEVKNYHPTVKPIRLMRWLVRLVSPPALDGVPPVVLETFGGSGTTIVAAELEGVRCIGIEMEPSYCDIIRARLTDAIGGEDGTTD